MLMAGKKLVSRKGQYVGAVRSAISGLIVAYEYYSLL